MCPEVWTIAQHCTMMQSIEMRFEDVDSLERSNEEGSLLGSIQQSLSQVAGRFTIKRLSTNNDHLVCIASA